MFTVGSALGTNSQLDAVEIADATAPCCDGMDRKGRHVESDSCFDRFVLELQLPIDSADIGRGSSHVQSDQFGMVVLLSDGFQSNGTTGGSRQDQLFCGCIRGIDQSAAAGHDAQVAFWTLADLISDIHQVLAHHWGEVSIHEGCFPP